MTSAPAGTAPPTWLACLLVVAAVAALGLLAVPRAELFADDHRFLSLLRDVDAGVPGAWSQALVVENRWDDDWWIEDGSYVRHFRPLLFLAFAVDRALWGEGARGFVAGNLALHALGSVLVLLCLQRMLRGRWPGLLGGLLFALQAARAEHVGYAAARNDTLAGVLVFASMWVFLRGRDRGGWRWHACLAVLFLLALLDKEYCVAIPAILLALDRWAPANQASAPARWRGLLWRRRWLYSVFGAVLAGWWILRTLALGAAGTGSAVAPYVHLPSREGFLEHVATNWLQACTRLVAGIDVTAFLPDLGALAQHASAVTITTSALVAAALLGWGLCTRGGRVLALLFLGTFVPLLPLYVTGRYLYVPSLGWCGLIALLAARIAQRSRAVAVLFALACLLSQAASLGAILKARPLRPPAESESDRVARLIGTSDLDLDGGPPVFLLDMPTHWLEIQFLQHTLDVRLPGRVPPVRVLCKGAIGGVPVMLRRVGPAAIELRRPQGWLYQPDPRGDFEQRRVSAGERIVEADYALVVLGEDEGKATHVRVEFERPLAELQLARFWPVDGGFRVERIE